MPKPALVNHGTDARLGSSEEARAGGAQAAGLSARQVPRCLNFPTLLSLPQARLVVPILPQDAVKDKKLTLKQGLDCCIPVLQHLLSFCAAGWPTPERWVAPTSPDHTTNRIASPFSHPHQKSPGKPTARAMQVRGGGMHIPQPSK